MTDAYLIMLALAALHIRLPAPLLRLAEVTANANAFLAMLSIGILFEINFGKKDLGEMARFFALRYGVVLALAAGVYWLLPLAADIRQALCVLLMAPVASVAPLLTRNAGGDGTPRRPDQLDQHPHRHRHDDADVRRHRLTPQNTNKREGAHQGPLPFWRVEKPPVSPSAAVSGCPAGRAISPAAPW